MNDIQRAGRQSGYHSWQVQYILNQPEIKPISNMKLTLYRYYSHVHCVSLQALQLYNSYRSHQDDHKMSNPFFQRFGCIYLNTRTAIFKHFVHCLAVFVFGDFFEFLSAKLAKTSCKGRAINPKLYCLSIIPTRSG